MIIKENTSMKIKYLKKIRTQNILALSKSGSNSSVILRWGTSTNLTLFKKFLK